MRVVGWLIAMFFWAAAPGVRAQFSLSDPKIDSAAARAASTLVIYNLRDPESVELAGYYRKARQIPAANLFPVECAETEEISRADYERTLAEPLRAAMLKQGWWRVSLSAEGKPEVTENRIRFIALMRGVPLKIAPEPVPPGQAPPMNPMLAGHNEACVDSELASLGYFNTQLNGPSPNPYFEKFSTIGDANLPMLMLVCRLDGPSLAITKRMIDDALAAEAHGLWGIGYADGRGLTGTGGLAEGDGWITAAAADMMKAGFPVVFDNGAETFPPNYPMTHAALYYGWYSWNADGPFLRPDFKFQRGAIAVHLHSFSGATVRSTTSGWVGPLLARGAAATVGNVYEPYLALTPHLDLLQNRLRNGFTFAESAYMAERVVSWMTTFVGDPLYTPFAAGAGVDDPAARDWIAYRDGARRWVTEGRSAGQTALETAARTRQSGLIYEGLGLLQAAARDSNAAAQSFQKARRFYTASDDVLRAALHEINLLGAAGRKAEALALARKEVALFPKAPAISVVRGIINQLAPPTPKPSAKPPTP